MPGPKIQRFALIALLASGCSINHLAEEGVADALSAQGDTFESDDDPQLVETAIPFGLKVMESLMPDLPKHRGLLLSACSGFAGFGYAFVQQPAEQAADPAAAKAGRERARKLFRRARDYCFRNLDVAYPGLAEALLLEETRPGEVPATSPRWTRRTCRRCTGRQCPGRS